MTERQVVVKPDAKLDIFEAAEWYESKKERLGFEFIDAVEDGLQFIRQYPKACQLVHKNARRLVLKRFPF